MKSNLFFFVLCFFSPLFELEKMGIPGHIKLNLWKLIPRKKIAHDKNKKKRVFRLFRVQACKATNHNQTSHNFLSIFLCVHGIYFIRYARSERRAFHVNLHCLHCL